MTNYLTKYARFTTIEEMDAAVEQHLSLHMDELTKSDRQVLDVIRRFSMEHGAAQLNHGTIQAAIGKANVTVRRAIRKFVNLHIIEKVHYIIPETGGLGANIYVILPFEDKGKMNNLNHIEV
ncbi:hypothetical protein [Sporosarcina sp. Marseille-Q4943]|uniref:hypothetical protein n=1 Tax=Sporosarcina sp. Marseille-Q4943 TaxID=2942204 RepID=UPI00208DA445|nr:hypothetical protein [Sporosarcina sp. Marseille-Q4943]